MKLAFSKTVQGHEIEFARLMYPLRYEIFVRNAIGDILELTLSKDINGVWTITEPGDFPAYISEISLSLHDAIEENEVSQDSE